MLMYIKLEIFHTNMQASLVCKQAVITELVQEIRVLTLKAIITNAVLQQLPRAIPSISNRTQHKLVLLVIPT